MISVAVLDQALQKELWSFFSTDAHQDNDRIRYINSAVRAICLSKNFNFNKYNYSITTDWIITDYSIPYQIETFWITDSNLDWVEYCKFEDYYLTKDRSSLIWIWEDSLVTTMAWTYNILYRWFPSSITNLTWTILIPEHFYDLVLVKAVAFWFADIKDYIKEANKNAIYNWMIKDMATRSSNVTPRKEIIMGANSVWF